MSDLFGSIPKPILLRGVIAGNLRSLRKKHNITQEKLSLLTGISRVSLSQYENCSQAISLNNLLLIANALNESPATILEGWEAAFELNN